ncbi:MAG: hypothetical protein V8R91_09840 [Butyricimonas faecihominis]
MGVYESLTREELVRKLLAQENLCHELQGKVGKLKEEISQQAKNGESMRANEGDLCENVTVNRTERFLTDNVARLSLMLEAGNVFPWYADIASGKIEIGDELFKAYGVDRKEFQDDFFSIQLLLPVFIRMTGEFSRLFIIIFWRESRARLAWNSDWIC